MTLTKADIAQAVSNKTNHTMAQSASLVDALFEGIKQTLESGEDVLISGFGKWSVRAKRERREETLKPESL
jgi:integration host factor subunit alpha